MTQHPIGNGIPIIVNKGRFRSVMEAAYAEKQVDWWDDSSPDTLICTQCFAAVELRRHLVLLTGADEADERSYPLLDGASLQKLPEGDCIVIGTPEGNAHLNKLWEQHQLGQRYGWSSRPAESYCAATVEDGGGRKLLLAGNDRTGTLYAVYAWLQSLGFRWFGLGEQGRVVPVASGETFRLPMADEADSPRFRTRGIYSEHIDDSSTDLKDWMGRSRVNFAFLDTIHNPHDLKKRGVSLCAGGHQVLSLFLNPHKPYPYAHALFDGDGGAASAKPADPYPVSPEYMGDANGDGQLSTFEAHPEWFGLVDGTRSSNVGQGDREGYGDNYCSTNADATEELCRNTVNDLIGGAWSQVDYVNFWMLDNGKWCSCERCEAAGNYSYKLILVVNRLRQHIKLAQEEGRLKRDVKLLYPVYHETLPAPDRPLPEGYDYESCYPTYFPIERCYVHRLNDEACTETNGDLMSTYRPWTTEPDRHYKGELFMGEYYNVGAFATIPVPFMTIMKQDIPFYYETGIRHFHYMHMSDRRWGTLALTNYQLYRMLWDPSLDVEALLHDYFTSYYGEVSGKMRHFYESLETAMRNAKFIKHYEYLGDKRMALSQLLKNDAKQLFPLKHVQYDRVLDDSNAGISFRQTVDTLAYCRSLIDDALMYAVSEDVAERVMEDEKRFSYLEDMIHYLYYMARTNIFRWSSRDALARRAFDHARIYAEKLEANTWATKPTTRFNLYDDALKASWCEPAYRHYLEIYGNKGDNGGG